MVMDLVIWPATLVPVVFPTRLFRRELFPLGIFQSGTTLGFKRVPRVEAHVRARVANRLVEEPAEFTLVALRAIPTPLLGRPPANVFHDQSRELQLMITPFGDDGQAAPLHHVCNGHPQDPRSPRNEQCSLSRSLFPFDDAQFHAKDADIAVYGKHTHNFAGCRHLVHGG